MTPQGFAAGLLLLSAAYVATADGATVTGSAILVTMDSNGKTEVLLGKPTFNESQILTFLAALNPFMRPIPMNPMIPMNPINPMNARYVRSAGNLYTTNVTTDSIVLVAPAWWDGSDPSAQDQYVAYILPKGLNSMTEEMKNQMLSSSMEGKRKIGLLLYPADISLLPNLIYSELFPLESMMIKDIKMVDKDMTGLKANVFMDAFGNARIGQYDPPWLILREVPADAVVVDGDEETEEVPMEGSVTEPPTRKRRSAEKIDPKLSGGVGTIAVNQDGKVTWSILPYFPIPPLISNPSIPPLPALQPIPIPDWSYFPFNPFWFFQYPFWPFAPAPAAAPSS